MPHESATNIPETGSIDLQKTRDHAEEYLADLKDSSNFHVIRTNKVLKEHLTSLQDAADSSDELWFRLVWKSINRDLAKVGLAKLHDL
jgi:hypothetical protein